MRVKLLLLGIAFFVSILDKSNASNKCYRAKICIHDGKEKCGQDMKGKVRRFLDSCDMKEYNCLKDTNYGKTDPTNCQKLPSIDKRPLLDDNVNDYDRNKNDSNLDGSSDNIDEADAEGKVAEANKENTVDGASPEDGAKKGSKENELGGISKLDDPDGDSKKEASDEVGKEDTVDRDSKEDASGTTELNKADIGTKKNEAERESKEGGTEGGSMVNEIDKANKDDGADRADTLNLSENGNDDGRTDGASEIAITKSTGRPTIESGKAAVINEYWCWRTKYCHRTGGVVCGRDRRLNKRQRFRTACDLYTHNCDEGHDFTVTDLKFCRGY